MLAALDLAVVVAATVLGAVMSLPQAVRLVRSGQVAGVSVTWAAMSVVTNSWWIAYGVAIDNWAIVPVSVVSIAGYLAVVTTVLRSPHPAARVSRLGLGAVAGVLAVPALVLTSSGAAALGVALGLIYGAQLAPAVTAAFRSADLSGIAVGTWLAAAGEAVLWGAHGGRNGDVGLLAMAATGLVMSAAVLARLAQWRLTEHGTGATTALAGA